MENTESQVASESTETTSTETTTEATVESGGEQVNETIYAGKFKSVSDLEKSYTELQSTFTKKAQEFADKVATSGAPEGGYTLDEGVEMTPRLEALMAKGTELGLNETAFKELLAADAETTMKQQEAYLSEQKEKLGKDADTRLGNIADWLTANAGEKADALKAAMTSAEAVEGMEMLIKQMQGTSAAPVQAKPMVDRDTLTQMRFAKDEFSNRKLSSDPQYRAKVEAMEAEFIANGGKLS